MKIYECSAMLVGHFFMCTFVVWQNILDSKMIRDKVSLKSWMVRKPYPLANGYDHYYKKLANKVYKLLTHERMWFEDLEYEKVDFVDLAISLTSHFLKDN